MKITGKESEETTKYTEKKFQDSIVYCSNDKLYHAVKYKKLDNTDNAHYCIAVQDLDDEKKIEESAYHLNGIFKQRRPSVIVFSVFLISLYLYLNNYSLSEIDIFSGNMSHVFGALIGTILYVGIAMFIACFIGHGVWRSKDSTKNSRQLHEILKDSSSRDSFMSRNEYDGALDHRYLSKNNDAVVLNLESQNLFERNCFMDIFLDPDRQADFNEIIDAYRDPLTTKKQKEELREAFQNNIDACSILMQDHPQYEGLENVNDILDRSRENKMIAYSFKTEIEKLPQGNL